MSWRDPWPALRRLVNQEKADLLGANMNVVKFPCFDFSDPRSGMGARIAAARYGRVVRFDTFLQRAFLDPERTQPFSHPARVMRFPLERTRAAGEL